jgi:chromosome segregation ATPase
MSRKFTIKLNEWYKKDFDGSKIGRNIRELTYEQKGGQNTIKDLKNWILYQSFENEDLCPCFIKIEKYSYYDNKKQHNILEECTNYNDDTLLDSTEFNENNIMYISFDKCRKCTCGKLNEMKGISDVISQKFNDKLEKEKKSIEENCERKIENNNRNHEMQMNVMINKHKFEMNQQNQTIMNLKKEINDNNRNHKEEINDFKDKLKKEKKSIEENCERKIEKNNRNHEKQMDEMRNKFNDQLNQQKQINKDLKKEINDNDRNHKEELEKTANDFKDKLKQQELKNMDLKKEMSKYEEKIKKNEDVIQSLDKSVREYDEKEKTYIQNKISAENEYNESLPQIFEDFYKDEKDSLIQEILKKMSSFLSEKLSLDDLVEVIIPKIAKKEKFKIYKRFFGR